MEHVGNKFIYSVNVSRENNKPINRPNENKPCLERPSQRLNEKEEQGLAVFLGLLSSIKRKKAEEGRYIHTKAQKHKTNTTHKGSECKRQGLKSHSCIVSL